MIIKWNSKTIKKEILLCKNWDEKISYLIYLSKNLPINKINIRKKKYILYNCNNKIWIKIYKINNNIFINADSNTILIKSILVIIISIYNRYKFKNINFKKIIKYFTKMKLIKDINIFQQVILKKIILHINNIIINKLYIYK